jgi:hypothetical protein
MRITVALILNLVANCFSFRPQGEIPETLHSVWHLLGVRHQTVSPFISAFAFWPATTRVVGAQ